MEATETKPTSPGISRAYIWTKFFSFIGVVPLAIYTFMHLYGNLTALQGPEAFNAHLEKSRSFPFIEQLTFLLIWLPFVAHAVLGLMKIRNARPNNIRFGTWDNLRYITQRLSAIGILLFVPAHVFKSKIQPAWLEGHPATYQHMLELAEPLTFIVYLLGILGVAYHVANGLWQAAIGWGITTTQKAMNRMQVFCTILFFVLLAMGYASLFTFARAGH